MPTLTLARRAATALALCLLFHTPASAETVKARVLDVNEKKSEVRVDVAGQGRTYHIDDRSLFRTLRLGRLVIITAELVSGRHTIVDARRAEQEGRVLEVDDRDGAARIGDVDTGSTDTYYLEGDTRRLRRGDVIIFEVEERSRRKVITRWTYARGGGGGNNNWGGGSNNLINDQGRIVDVDKRRTELTIELFSSNRRQTFAVSDRRLLETLQNGDRVNFRYERRGNDKPVILSIQ